MSLGFPWGLPRGRCLGSVPPSGALRYLSPGIRGDPVPRAGAVPRREMPSRPPLAAVQPGGQVRCGAGGRRRTLQAAGAADPGRRARLRCSGGSDAAPGTLWRARSISALNKGARRTPAEAPGPGVRSDAEALVARGTRSPRRCGRTPVPARGAERPPPPRRGGAAQRGRRRRRARHPRDAEPIRAPSWRCPPGPARRRPARRAVDGEALPREPAVASPRSMGIESFCSADASEPFWVSGGTGPRRRGSAAAAGVGTEGWRGAGRGWDGGGARGGCARQRGSGSLRCRHCPGQSAGAAVPPGCAGREHRRGAAAGRRRGRAGPCRRLVVSAWARCPHGRVAERAPALRARRFGQGDAWRGEPARGACPGDREGAPKWPGQGLPTRSAARLRYSGLCG